MRRFVITIFSTFFAASAIFAQGKVGVNTTTPEATLDVKGNTNDKTAIFRNGMGGEAITITNVGTIGIAEPNPKAYIDIKAAPGVGPGIKLQDGTQGMGKVLTSDAEGNANWQSIPILPPPPANPSTAVSSIWASNIGSTTKSLEATQRTFPVAGHFSVPKTGWYFMQSRWFYVQNTTADEGDGYFWIQINESPTNAMDIPGQWNVYEYRATVNGAIGICPPSGALVYLKQGAKYYVHSYTRNTSYAPTGERQFTFYLLQ